MGMEQQRRRLGKRAQRLRLARTWSQENVAQRAGVSAKSVSNLERGENVRPATLRNIMAVFGDEGVEALRAVGFDEWADTVAQAVENGVDERIQRAVQDWVAANWEDLKRQIREDT